MTECWLGPDLNADLLELVERPEDWPAARPYCARLQLYQQQIGVDDSPAPVEVGPNTYANLTAGDFFRRAGALGLPLAFEGPGLKAWDATGQQEAFAITRAIERIRDAGGDVATFTLDDPLCAALQDFPDSPWSVTRAVEPVAHVLRAADQLTHPGAPVLRGGITEAYPSCSAGQIVDFFEQLQQAGESPAHLHLDVDAQAMYQRYTRRQITHDWAWLQSQCRAWGIPFGIILNGQRGDDLVAYRQQFFLWLQQVHDLLGGYPDRLILQSWKKQPLPMNLPDHDKYSHTGLLREVGDALRPFHRSPE